MTAKNQMSQLKSWCVQIVMHRLRAGPQVRDIFVCVYNVLMAFFNVWRLYIQIYFIGIY